MIMYLQNCNIQGLSYTCEVLSPCLYLSNSSVILYLKVILTQTFWLYLTFCCLDAVIPAAKCLVESEVINIWSKISNPKRIFLVCIISSCAAVVQFKSNWLKWMETNITETYHL